MDEPSRQDAETSVTRFFANVLNMTFDEFDAIGHGARIELLTKHGVEFELVDGDNIRFLRIPLDASKPN